MQNLNSFFSPKSIAIVGASPKAGKLGNVLNENLKKGGWQGKLYCVNPKYAKSRKGYFSSLCEIKKPVDLVLVAIPAQFVNQAIEDGAKSKPEIKNFAVISSGFKESGSEGKILEENLKILAQKYSLNILGPNCLGFTNPYEKINATFTDAKMQKGNIAIVSQSGALAVALLDWAAGKNIGFSKIISIGNKTALDESAILNFLATDQNTKTIALYLEDIKRGRDFMAALAKITSRKPVIVLKAGKTSAGQKAVISHTGSLAQDEDVIEAVFEKLNVISVNNTEEFQDIIYYLNFCPVPENTEAIVITNAGGPGVMASDFVGKSKSVKLLEFPADFKNGLKNILSPSASVENPIDIIGDAPPERYQKTLESISRHFSDYPVLAILTPQNQTNPEKVAQILAKFKSKIQNLSACFMGGEKIARAKVILEKYNVPCFENPERSLAVIEKLVKYSHRLVIASGAKQSRVIQNSSRLPRRYAPRNDIAIALSKNRKMLFWKEAEKLFRKQGAELTKAISIEHLDDLKNKKILFPCALKTDDPGIAHRLEKNAVILNIQNLAELKKVYEKLKVSTGAKHYLVQPMAAPGLELIVGMKRDPSFGPVILCGWGGSFTEVFRDRAILMPPLDSGEIKARLSQLSIFPILKGFRGKKGYDLGEISKIISAVAQISLENPAIAEIDINPLVVYNDGKKGQILDAKIFL